MTNEIVPYCLHIKSINESSLEKKLPFISQEYCFQTAKYVYKTFNNYPNLISLSYNSKKITQFGIYHFIAKEDEKNFDNNIEKIKGNFEESLSKILNNYEFIFKKTKEELGDIYYVNNGENSFQSHVRLDWSKKIKRPVTKAEIYGFDKKEIKKIKYLIAITGISCLMCFSIGIYLKYFK